MSTPMIGFWKGIPVDQMTLEQARETIMEMGRALTTIQNEKGDMMRRNAILRTRPDLPMTDEQKAIFKQLEVHIQHMQEMSTEQVHRYRRWIEELIAAGNRLARLESRDQFAAQCAWSELLKRGMLP